MTKKNILFIVEGESSEVKLLRKIGKIITNFNYQIYSYRTSIYELYDELKLEQDLDILLVLREHCTIKKQKPLFDKQYTDIYLIFDFDPHHQKYSQTKISEMLNFFTESTEMGKLLINYPMLESYRHLGIMPDLRFKELTIDVSTLTEYKKIVNVYSDYCDINSYDFKTIIHLTMHHIAKYNYILTGKFETLDLDSYYKVINPDNDVKLLQIQVKMLEEEDCLYVVNTSAFYIFNILPKTFFNSQHAKYSFKKH